MKKISDGEIPMLKSPGDDKKEHFEGVVNSRKLLNLLYQCLLLIETFHKTMSDFVSETYSECFMQCHL